MSDVNNRVEADSVLKLEELVEVLGLPVQTNRSQHLVAGDRIFLAQCDVGSHREELLIHKNFKATVSFKAFLRGTTVTEEMLSSEIDVVMAFLGNREAMPSGSYHHENEPFLRWDWNDYGIQVNAHPERWQTNESQLVRGRMNEVGIAFEARRCETHAARSGIYAEPAGAQEPVLLWNWFHVGADQLRASLELLAAVVGVSAGFSPYPEEPNSYLVEIEALEELIRQIVATAQTEPDRLKVLADWRSVLTSAVALLINSGRPVPDALDDSWGELVTDASKLAPRLLEDPRRDA